MSQENVEIVRRLIEREPGTLSESDIVGDEFEFILEGALDFEGQSVWRGLDGFREWFGIWPGTFEDWSVQNERLIDAGDDSVVALTHQSGTGRESGVRVEMDVATIFELREGRLLRMRNFLSRADALQAAGLSE